MRILLYTDTLYDTSINVNPINSETVASKQWCINTTYFFKTKTTFSRPRPVFLKTIKLLIQDLKKCFLTKKGQLCRFCAAMPVLCQ